MKLNLLDLFSGIGGFHLGLERAGYKVNSYFSEVDKYAIDVYKNKFKNSTYVGSVTDVRGAELPRIDAITFGSPCQDFSLAGKRKGMEGERSSLILEAIRLIKECRPRFFIWENVKGTFSSNSGEDFAAILQAFANIGDYTIEWQLLNTKWFLPQNRERVYLVGYTGARSGQQVFPIRESIGAAEGLAETRQESACITTSYRKGINYDNQLIRVPTNNSKGYETMSPGDSLNYANPKSKTRRGRVGKGVAQTLDTGCEQAVIDKKIISYSRDKKGKVVNRNLKDDANTVHTSTGTGNNTDQYVLEYNNIRRLTPVECERLQGFPDNWTANGATAPISDTQRYKMCGNAVTVDVVAEVAKNIKRTIKRI